MKNKYVINTVVSKDYIINFQRWLYFYNFIRKYPIHIMCEKEETRDRLTSYLDPRDEIKIVEWTRRHDIWKKRILQTLRLLDKYEFVINTDLDAYWLSDNIYDVVEMNSKYDILTSVAPGGFPPGLTPKWKGTLCCGFQVFKNSDQTRDFLQHILSEKPSSRSKRIWNRYSDQGILNLVLYEGHTQVIPKEDKFIVDEIYSLGLHIGCLKQRCVKRFLPKDSILENNPHFFVVHILESHFKHAGYNKDDIDRMVVKLLNV